MENYRKILNTVNKIRSTSHNKSIKIQILKTYLFTFVLNSNQKRNKLANITGFNVNYCTTNSLRYLFNEIFLGNEYNFSTDTQKPLIIDCGSNIGMSVLYFKLLFPESEILAFEPDEDAFECLERNIQQNNLKNVVLEKKALSSLDGIMDFYFDQNNPGSLKMSTIYARMPKQKREITSARLSQYIEKEIDFLKLDIEGAEWE